MIKSLLKRLKGHIEVDLHMEEETFRFCTTTTIMGEEFSKVEVDATPIYEIFKARLMKELSLKAPVAKKAPAVKKVGKVKTAK